MAHKSVLDTHALIWYLEGSSRLGGSAKLVMDDPSSQMVLPVIALAEALHIVGKGRTKLPGVSDLLHDVASDDRIELSSLTLDVLIESLTASVVPEMHDRLIVGTALHLQRAGHQVSLLTKDATIVSAGIVPVIW